MPLLLSADGQDGTYIRGSDDSPRAEKEVMEFALCLPSTIRQ